jgi:hypothetical protein
MVKCWQPTPQEIDLIADMLDANRSKSAIAKFVYVSERPCGAGGPGCERAAAAE